MYWLIKIEVTGLRLKFCQISSNENGVYLEKRKKNTTKIGRSDLKPVYIDVCGSGLYACMVCDVGSPFGIYALRSCHNSCPYGIIKYAH